MTSLALAFDILAKDKASPTLNKVGNSIDKTAKQSSEFGKVFKRLGQASVLGLATVAVASVKMAGDYQASLTSLVTGAGESQKNIKQVGQGMLDLAGKVGIGANDLAKGMYLIESSGKHGAEGLLVLKAAAEGARVGAADMATVADGLTTALNDYKIPASQAAVVTSQLVATVAAGKTHMGDLAGALATVLPAASAAHVGLSQVLGAMATMTAAGTPAADAATYLKQTIAQLSNPTAKAALEMKNLGLSSIDISKNLGSRGLTGTLDLLTSAIAKHMGPAGTVLIETLKKSAGSTTDFQKVLADLPPTQQTYIAALAKMVGGTKSMQAALELTGSNAKTFRANVKAIGGATTEAGGHVKGFALTQKDLNTQIANLTATAKSLMIEIGDKLIPIIETSAAWFGRHKDVAIALASVVGGALLVAMVAYIGSLVVSSAQMLLFAARVVLINGSVLASIALNYAAAAAAGVWTAAQWLLNAALSANPIGLIVIALAALAVGLYEAWKHSETFRDIVVGAFEVVKTSVGALLAFWTSAWDDVVSVFGAVWRFLRKHVALIIGALFLIDPPLALLIAVIHQVYKHWSTVWAAIRTVTLAAFSILRGGVSRLVSFWRAEWQILSSVVSVVWTVLSRIFGFIVRNGLGVIRSNLQTLQSAWSAGWHVIESVVTKVWHVLKPIFDAIIRAAKAVGSAVGGVAGAAKSVTGGAGSILSGIGHQLGFADGGFVPGPIGKAVPAIVHGGEFVVSNAMQRAARKAPGGVVHNNYVTVNNPVAEPASNLPRVLSNMTYLLGSA